MHSEAETVIINPQQPSGEQIPGYYEGGLRAVGQVVKVGAMAAGPVESVVSAVHELDKHTALTMPWAENLPLADHSSSIAASTAIAASTSVVAEALAGRLELRGRETAAERVRRAGNIISWAGSIAYQLAVETTPQGGVSDKWDIVAGLVSTAPAIMLGTRVGRGIKSRSE